MVNRVPCAGLAAAIAALWVVHPAFADPSSLPPPPLPPGARPAKATKGPPSSGSASVSVSATATAHPAAAPAGHPSDDEPVFRGNGALDTRWAVGAMLGASTDYLGFGFGLRGGKTLDNHVYLGGSFIYHFADGGDYSVSAPTGVGAYSTSASAYYVGPEVGYDFDAQAVVVRVYAGVGPAFFSSSVKGPGVDVSGSSSQLVFWPGVSVLRDVGDTPFYVGGDVRFVSVPGGPAVGFFANGGLHFGT